jgi:hypothetical protein
VRNLLTSVCEVAGLGLIAVGFGLFAVPLGVIAAGCALFAVGYKAAQ